MNRKVFLYILFAFFFLITAAPVAHAQQQKLPTDRWTWLELYWVDHDHIPESVSTYLDRVYPLFKNASGWRGVAVNPSWVADYITEWQGDLDQRVTLPPRETREFWNHLSPELQRRPPPFERIVYAQWTYRDLKRLAEEFVAKQLSGTGYWALRSQAVSRVTRTFITRQSRIGGPSTLKRISTTTASKATLVG